MSQADSAFGIQAGVPPGAATPPPLRLPAQLGIDHVAALKQELLPLLEEPAPVVLDAERVERVHSAAIQLFCLFCRDRRAEGREVEFARPSPALLSAASLLGTSSLLRLAQGAA